MAGLRCRLSGTECLTESAVQNVLHTATGCNRYTVYYIMFKVIVMWQPWAHTPGHPLHASGVKMT